jgi:cytochrome P450
MVDMIEERTTAPEARQDLFSNLLKAREEEKNGSTVFSDSDLMG